MKCEKYEKKKIYGKKDSITDFSRNRKLIKTMIEWYI